MSILVLILSTPVRRRSTSQWCALAVTSLMLLMLMLLMMTLRTMMMTECCRQQMRWLDVWRHWTGRRSPTQLPQSRLSCSPATDQHDRSAGSSCSHAATTLTPDTAVVVPSGTGPATRNKSTRKWLKINSLSFSNLMLSVTSHKQIYHARRTAFWNEILQLSIYTVSQINCTILFLQ